MFDDGGKRRGQPARRLRVGPAEGAGDRLARFEHGERLRLTHGGRDGINDGHRNTVAHFRREPGKRRAGQDDDIGAVLFDRLVGERDQQLFLDRKSVV